MYAPRVGALEAAQAPGHRRNKSSSVLKSLVLPAQPLDKASTARGRPASSPAKENKIPNNRATTIRVPLLPPDHPHARTSYSDERPRGQSQSPMKSKKIAEGSNTRPSGLQKRTKSSMSLRSLGKSRKADGSVDNSQDKELLVKKKSSTNLVGMFSKKSARSKDQMACQSHDKENTTPEAKTSEIPMRTPIWEQFASSSNITEPQVGITMTVPLNDLRAQDHDIVRYQPKDYSPSKQRHFLGDEIPALATKKTARPKSDGLTLSKAPGFMDALGRKFSNEKQENSRRRSKEEQDAPSQTNAGVTRCSRVMAAVSMYNSKSQDADIGEAVDPTQQEANFEAFLDAQNVSEHVRKQMRSLKAHVKADMMRANGFANTPAPSPTKSGFQLWSEPGSDPAVIDGALNAEDRAELANNVLAENDSLANNAKRTRPRSKTFTFSKGDASPSKKHKREASQITGTTESTVQSTTATSLAKMTGGLLGAKTNTAAAPEDYVDYLRRVQQPEVVEVGRLHKLRLLLRNETVSWVDKFIKIGGMTEVVGLLNRIMAVEWREEHEDALLHETLLCLKGLCTTDLAIQKLQQIEKTLFPALLAMLFDSEHKGPSEFNTRKIIIDLLFASLTASTKDESRLESRAEVMLSFLQDPSAPEDKRPLNFIEEMRTRRPYKMWCKEIVDVTKEVFWIFLHHMNVVPLPSPPQTTDSRPTTANAPSSRPTSSHSPAKTPKPIPQRLDLTPDQYLTQFYPQPRPPIPAAPYVGGVEWDATNYLASHLDLINALLACLPTPTARNTIRQDLRLSGLEKVMGGMLRTCKEKFYSAVHDGLRTWVAAAAADGWDVSDVRFGAEMPEGSPKKSPVKGGKAQAPPQIEVPKLDLGIQLDGVVVGDAKGEKGLGDWIL